jgi:hypothetical protein
VGPGAPRRHPARVTNYQTQESENMMSPISTTRRSAKKAIRNVAATIVTAGVASAALAAPASAIPIDTFSINAGATQFGTNCVGPLGNAELDWRENLAAGTVKPIVTGRICLQSTNRRARLLLQYRDAADALILQVGSAPVQGSAAGLATFSVSLSGPTISSAIMNHVHIVLEDDRSGALAPVGTSYQYYP